MNNGKKEERFQEDIQQEKRSFATYNLDDTSYKDFLFEREHCRGNKLDNIMGYHTSIRNIICFNTMGLVKGKGEIKWYHGIWLLN